MMNHANTSTIGNHIESVGGHYINKEKSEKISYQDIDLNHINNPNVKKWTVPGSKKDPFLLNKRIENARKPSVVFEIINENQQSMTSMNLKAAFLKLVTFKPDVINKKEMKKNATFHDMLCTTAANASIFKKEELCSIIWALAELKVEPELPIMQAIMFSLYSELNNMDTNTLSIVLWSLASMNYVPSEKVLRDICKILLVHLNERRGSAHNFSQALWSLAVMGWRPATQLLELSVTLTAKALNEMTLNDITPLLWAYIQFEFFPTHQFLTAVKKNFSDLSGCKSSDLAFYMWCFSNMQHALEPALILKIIKIVEENIEEEGWPILARVLNACARLCFHPGREFLELGSKILINNIDDIYFEAIETILWSYATFSFCPGNELLKLLSVKIEKHLCLFTPVHLANMLWCYSLFQFCSSDLWKTIINQIANFRIHEIPAEALFRIYQVWLYQITSEQDFEQNLYALPNVLENPCQSVWISQIDLVKQNPSFFHNEVSRIISSLNIKVFEKFVTNNNSLCLNFYFETLNKGFDLIEPHEYTLNTSQPIGSAVMRTRILNLCLSGYMGRASVQFIEYTTWNSLKGDIQKQEYIKDLIKN